MDEAYAYMNNDSCHPGPPSQTVFQTSIQIVFIKRCWLSNYMTDKMWLSFLAHLLPSSTLEIKFFSVIIAVKSECKIIFQIPVELLVALIIRQNLFFSFSSLF